MNVEQPPDLLRPLGTQVHHDVCVLNWYANLARCKRTIPSNRILNNATQKARQSDGYATYVVAAGEEEQVTRGRS